MKAGRQRVSCKSYANCGKDGNASEGVVTIACLMLVACLPVAQAEGKTKIEKGTLGASRIMVAVPGRWNKNVLILVHGLRGESSPLTAEFDPNAPPEKQLLSEGWIVASTSFR